MLRFDRAVYPLLILQVLSLQRLEESLDPTIELTRLVKERKLEDAFNKALSLSDVAVVSWLCMQVCDMSTSFFDFLKVSGSSMD